MEKKSPKSWPNKRPHGAYSDSGKPRKKVFHPVRMEDVDVVAADKNFKFRVLLPNGKSVEVRINRPQTEISMEEMVNELKQEYTRVLKQNRFQPPKRGVNWKSTGLHLVDVSDNKFDHALDLRRFEPNKWNLLRLKDGSEEAQFFENMWDLTPDTDLLKELPSEHSFETALADLIDNALQAVWSNAPAERKLISVEVSNETITIVDTGPGLDEYSLDKWGKMGASLHRSARKQAIGGKPPYLTPFFGMFGYGGPIASMKLGERALISSKKKGSMKVFSLLLDREALLMYSSVECRWRADGGLRDPSEEELVNFPNGSFMKIEISAIKVRVPEIQQLQRKLKDIYFPYIQCDSEDNSGQTVRHIEFQVNGTNLAEVEAGEVAITNFHSCNGASFTFQLKFSKDTCSGSQGPESREEANARLKFVYFPIVQGKETIERILEQLEEYGYGLAESYENFSRVSIRRLGRLLPDARWLWLPFMDLRQRKWDKAQLFRRCSSRIKCFIETDAGFIPTTSKTDLAHHHPYTIALKNFGKKSFDNHKEVNVVIFKDEKQISLQHLDKKYQEWILQMHDQYDEEIDCGEDEPTYVVGFKNKKELGISSDVLRIHKVIRRKGFAWKSGQKIKILKGACAGFHRTTIYATLEYIILEGLQGDAGGEARLVCRPIGLPDEKGCLLIVENGSSTLQIGESISAPLSVIDSGKCLAIREDEWNSKLEICHQKTPSSIELLNAESCQELEVEKALPSNAVCAGYKPPDEIIAVIRPASFGLENASKSLSQKYIVKENHEMGLEINFEAEHHESRELIYSAQVSPMTLKGFQGLYIFSLKEVPNIFERAGAYTFSLSLKGQVRCELCEKRVQVKPSPEVGSWKILRNKQTVNYIAMVGSCFVPLKIGCHDKYGNQIPFGSVPEVKIHFNATKGVLIYACNREVSLSQDKLVMSIKDLLVESSDLDKIRPKYEATLLISPVDDAVSVSIPCQVLPGPLECVKVQCPDLRKQLLPGGTVKELILEVFDKYGNHLKRNEDIQLHMDGFHILDSGFNRKVDDHGCVNLSGILKITKGFGEIATLSVFHGDEFVFKEEFQIEKRELRTAFEVPKICLAGSQLGNLVFEVTTSEGEVDESYHDKDENGNSHTLTIKSDTLDLDDSIQYAFRRGRCYVRAISLPREAGVFSFVASHSSYSQLRLEIEFIVDQPENVWQENTTPQNSDELACQDSPAQIIQKMDHQDVIENQIGKLALVHVAPSNNQEVTKLISGIQTEQKELEDEMLRHAEYVGDQEKVLTKLKFEQLLISEKLSGLQASVDHNTENNPDDAAQKMMIMKKMALKCNNAAAVVSKLLKSPPSEKRHREFVDNILGVVALLGSVQSKELSMILSRYIGEDQMLAVVCKTYSAASAFEKYEQPGQINSCSVFNELARKLGCSDSGGFVVMCLEDVRSYPGLLGRDPQRKLALLDPALADGSAPQGFLGYAVNMIHFDKDNLQWRNAVDLGLRETIFYGLFGELQIYENKDCMYKARSCIKEDAVSLDGGIMRRGILMSLGEWEPDIHFPVVPDTQGRCSQEMEQLDRKLHRLTSEVEQKEQILEETRRKFFKRRDRYNKFLDSIALLLASYYSSQLSYNDAATPSS